MIPKCHSNAYLKKIKKSSKIRLQLYFGHFTPYTLQSKIPWTQYFQRKKRHLADFESHYDVCLNTFAQKKGLVITNKAKQTNASGGKFEKLLYYRTKLFIFAGRTLTLISFLLQFLAFHLI